MTTSSNYIIKMIPLSILLPLLSLSLFFLKVTTKFPRWLSLGQSASQNKLLWQGDGMVLNTQAGTACHRSGWQVASTTQSIWTVSGGLVGPPQKNQGLLSERGTREEKLAEMTEAHHTSPGLMVQGCGFAVLQCSTQSQEITPISMGLLTRHGFSDHICKEPSPSTVPPSPWILS